MKVKMVVSTLFAGVATCVAVCSSSAKSETSLPAIQISADAIIEGQVVIFGKSGVELGTVFEMTGHVIQGNMAGKGDDSPRYLVVDAVNGVPLKAAAKYPVERVIGRGDTKQGEREWALPAAGTSVRFAAYEDGCFRGAASGKTYEPIGQSHGYMFLLNLIVCHDFEIRPRPPSQIFSR